MSRRRDLIWQIVILGDTEGYVDEDLIRKMLKQKLSQVFRPNTFKVADVRNLRKPKRISEREPAV